MAAGGSGWAPLRDAIRRDVEQAISALAFAERLHQKMDTQRRAFLDFPRIMATLRRAALPRRSPGPWRADREVLEEARRAVEFVQKLYDAYADGWADQPLTKDLGEQTAAELDRFLAWTQLDRYVELAVLASTNVPRPSKPGQHVISAAKEVVPQPPVTEASPGAVVADSEPGPAGEPEEEEPASPQQSVVEPELGRD